MKEHIHLKILIGGTVDKNLPANAGAMGSISGAGRSHRPWGVGRVWHVDLVQQVHATITELAP